MPDKSNLRMSSIMCLRESPCAGIRMTGGTKSIKRIWNMRCGRGNHVLIRRKSTWVRGVIESFGYGGVDHRGMSRSGHVETEHVPLSIARYMRSAIAPLSDVEEELTVWLAAAEELEAGDEGVLGAVISGESPAS